MRRSLMEGKIGGVTVGCDGGVSNAAPLSWSLSRLVAVALIFLVLRARKSSSSTERGRCESVMAWRLKLHMLYIDRANR